jgi:hypothetical protein
LAALWAGLVAGPLAWAALLEVNYVLSYVSCEHHRTWMLHAATVAALLLTAGAALAASRTWRDTLRRSGAETGANGNGRAWSMAVGGIAMCLWFVLVIVATEIPVLVLRPCTP